MSSKPGLLYIAHRIPYPPNKGDKIRTFNELRFLSQHFAIDLVALVDDPHDFQFRKPLESYCRTVHLFGLNRKIAAAKGGLSLIFGASISKGYFGHSGAQKRVAELLALNRYEAILCFSSPTAQYLAGSAHLKGACAVMDFCDVDSEKWRQYAARNRGVMKWIYSLEARRLARYEVELSRRFDASVFVSKAEADLFRPVAPHNDRVHAVSNGVDYDYFSPGGIEKKQSSETSKTNGSFVLMFPGAMDYHANVQGVSWFAGQVLPKLCRRLEKEGLKVRFDIVGKNPVPEVWALAENECIRVTGFVEDIRPYYRQADVVVIPLQVARGIQNKVLEAMAMARPVVATPQAIEGIAGVENNHFRVAATAEQFVDAILAMVGDPEAGRKMGGQARAFIKEKFSWDDCLAPLLRILHGQA